MIPLNPPDDQPFLVEAGDGLRVYSDVVGEAAATWLVVRTPEVSRNHLYKILIDNADTGVWENALDVNRRLRALPSGVGMPFPTIVEADAHGIRVQRLARADGPRYLAPTCDARHYLFALAALRLPQGSSVCMRLCKIEEADHHWRLRGIKPSVTETFGSALERLHSPDHLRAALLQILFCIQTMHALRLVHHDLHPCNVLVTWMVKPVALSLGDRPPFPTPLLISIVDWDFAAWHGDAPPGIITGYGEDAFRREAFCPNTDLFRILGDARPAIERILPNFYQKGRLSASGDDPQWREVNRFGAGDAALLSPLHIMETHPDLQGLDPAKEGLEPMQWVGPGGGAEHGYRTRIQLPLRLEAPAIQTRGRVKRPVDRAWSEGDQRMRNRLLRETWHGNRSGLVIQQSIRSFLHKGRDEG